MKPPITYTQTEKNITILAAIIAFASCILFTSMNHNIIENDNIMSITCAIVCILALSEIIFIKFFKEYANGNLKNDRPVESSIFVVGIIKLVSIFAACFASAVLFVLSIGLYQTIIMLQPIWLLLILLFLIFMSFVIANKKLVMHVYHEK